MNRALIIFAHPYAQSFNHALLETAEAALKQRGAEVRVRDLYTMGFDPVLRGEELADRSRVAPDVLAAQADITWADTLIFIYPIWWMDRPAILKGWFDRVFTNGFAFTMQGGYRGLLAGKRAIVFQTLGGGEKDYGAEGEAVLKGTIGEGTLGFAGITDITFHRFWRVTSAPEAARREMLETVRAALA